MAEIIPVNIGKKAATAKAIRLQKYYNSVL
jgi:hypothetical protein